MAPADLFAAQCLSKQGVEGGSSPLSPVVASTMFRYRAATSLALAANGRHKGVNWSTPAAAVEPLIGRKAPEYKWVLGTDGKPRRQVIRVRQKRDSSAGKAGPNAPDASVSGGAGSSDAAAGNAAYTWVDAGEDFGTAGACDGPSGFEFGDMATDSTMDHSGGQATPMAASSGSFGRSSLRAPGERRDSFVEKTAAGMQNALAALLAARGARAERCANPQCGKPAEVFCDACSLVAGWCAGCDAERHGNPDYLHRRIRIDDRSIVPLGQVWPVTHRYRPARMPHTLHG